MHRVVYCTVVDEYEDAKFKVSVADRIEYESKESRITQNIIIEQNRTEPTI